MSQPDRRQAAARSTRRQAAGKRAPSGSRRRRVDGRPREAVGPQRRVRTDPRFSRRRRAVDRARRRRTTIRLGIVLALAALTWTILWSPLLAVRELKVVGGRHTAVSDVARATGLDNHDNLLLVSTDEVEERTRSLPWVADVKVARMLPGTIRLRITERKPTLVLAVGAKRWSIDAEGRVLAAGAARPGLPVLAGIQVHAVTPGVHLRTSEARAAIGAFAALPRDLRRDVVGIFAPTLERITFSLEDDTLVRYGAAEHLAAKNEVMRVLRSRLRANGESAAYIDVRVPSSPAISAVVPAGARPDVFDD